MLAELGGLESTLGAVGETVALIKNGFLVLIGFSLVIFVHELGHFLAARWMGVRVGRFAVGFFNRVCGYRRGEGFTIGRRPDYTADELTAKGYGETDYCLNILPFGGYVKMLGQDDIMIDEQTGEVQTSDDPRSFTNKSVGQRMVVVSGGVVFNMLFAVLVYVLVYTTAGRNMLAPVIGHVETGTPAAAAGLVTGDRIVSIDGDETNSFDDIGAAWFLGGNTLHLRVERGGQLLDRDFVVEFGLRDGEKERFGMHWMYAAELSADVELADGSPGPRRGDRIIEINGKPVTNGFDVAIEFQKSAGQPVELTVQRNADAPQTLTYEQRPVLRLEPARLDSDDDAHAVDSRHLLGFRRREVVQFVAEGSAARQAGFQVADAIAQWGSVVNPLYGEIVQIIEVNDGKRVSVVVERNGQLLELEVTPRRAFRLFGSEPPKVGVAFVGEEDRAIVAAVARDTPAHALGMPRGSEILAIDDRPVHNWSDVYQTLRAAAGNTITLRYRSAGDEVTAQMNVPSSVVNELDLPVTAQITRIDEAVGVRLESGKPVELPAAQAVRRLFEKNVGRTVTVEYVPSLLDLEPVHKEFTVRADNTDPWQLRAYYADAHLALAPLEINVSARWNPIKGTMMGVNATGDDLVRIYRTIQRMIEKAFTRAPGGVSVKNVAGPVGIFQMAYGKAESGVSDLLCFLAFISVNLAVLNFLPLPVVDGGLMVFLILEKIRRKPVSIKIQVTATLVGLVLILGVFLLVTFQDVTRLWNGP